MQVTKREGYAIKNENEINLSAEASKQQETSATQTTQEIVNSPTQAKAATDFANARKVDDLLQANLLKDQLSGLQKNATKFVGENVGVIKDNMGKDIARHDGPGISDMFNMGRKQGLEKGNPLADQPSINGGKKKPDMPFKKNNSEWAKNDDGRQGLLPNIFKENAKTGPTFGEKFAKDHPDKVRADVNKAIDILKKAAPGNNNDGGTKYIDPDHNDGTQIEKPKDPPPNAHDRLGHKVDSGNTLVSEYDPKSVVQAHKDRNKPFIHMDPDQQPMDILFDPANPPRLEGEELKNTGNPIDNNAPRPAAPRPKQDGSKPHTDGEGTQ